MGDWAGKVRSGEKLKLPATTLNNAIDAARAERASRLDRGLPPGVASLYSPTTIRIQNDTEDDFDIFAVVKLGDPAITPTDNLEEWQQKPSAKGTTPDAIDNTFAILAEPVPAGDIGRGVVLGATPVQINVTDEDHDFATPTATDATKLTSADAGPAFILWKESGTGTKWALVLLLGTSPAVADHLICLAVATTNVASLNSTTTIDGVGLSNGDLVLLTAQSTASENGPWKIGTPWSRPGAYPTAGVVGAGFVVFVAAGTVYAKTEWRLRGASDVTVDTTSTTWDIVNIPRLSHCLAAADANVSSLSGTTTIDGVSLADGDRVLLTAQSTSAENGPWVVRSSSWNRPVEYAAGSSVAAGFVAFIAGGTVYKETEWRLSGTSAVTVGTTSTTWHPIVASLTQKGIITLTDQIVGDGRKQFQTLIVDQSATTISSAYLPADGFNINAGPGGNLIIFHTGTGTGGSSYADMEMNSGTDGLGSGGSKQALFFKLQTPVVAQWSFAENGYCNIQGPSVGDAAFAVDGNKGATGTSGGGDSVKGGIIVSLGSGATPSGSAGGSLTGTYPNPTIANGAVTLAMINSGAGLSATL